jgi:hypothetical protein
MGRMECGDSPFAGKYLQDGAVWAMRHIVLVLLAGFPTFLLSLLVSFRLFDELLRVQFSKAYEDWERCGRPSGYFWKAPGSHQFSLRGRGHLWSHWYLYRPSWVDTSEEARKLYRRFRLAGGLTMIVFAPVFVACCWLLTTAFVSVIAFLAEHAFGWQR